MKKITILSIVLAGLAFASCRKDRTCECTETVTISGTAYTTVSSTKVKSTKKDGEAWCATGDGSKTTVTVNGQTQTSSGGTKPTCTLK